MEKILLTPSIPACQVPSVEFSFVDTAGSKGISEETVCLANVNRLVHNMHLQSTTSLEPGPAGNQYAVCIALASQLRLGLSYRERGGGCPTIMNPNVSMIVFFPLVLILIIYLDLARWRWHMLLASTNCTTARASTTWKRLDFLT